MLLHECVSLHVCNTHVLHYMCVTLLMCCCIRLLHYPCVTPCVFCTPILILSSHSISHSAIGFHYITLVFDENAQVLKILKTLKHPKYFLSLVLSMYLHDLNKILCSFVILRPHSAHVAGDVRVVNFNAASFCKRNACAWMNFSLTSQRACRPCYGLQLGLLFEVQISRPRQDFTWFRPLLF